jgi:S1-C subfamily serine protease
MKFYVLLALLALIFISCPPLEHAVHPVSDASEPEHVAFVAEGEADEDPGCGVGKVDLEPFGDEEDKVELREFDFYRQASAELRWKNTHGTGVCIASDGVYSILLSAAHLYRKGESPLVIRADGKVVPGVMYAVCKDQDFALIKVKMKFPAVPIRMKALPWGARILLVGNKLGGGMWISEGLYSGLKRIKNYGNDSDATPLLRGKTTAASHPGNSGGGVFYKGALVGILQLAALQGHAGRLLPTENMALFATWVDIVIFLNAHDVEADLEDDDIVALDIDNFTLFKRAFTIEPPKKPLPKSRGEKLGPGLGPESKRIEKTKPKED